MLVDVVADRLHPGVARRAWRRTASTPRRRACRAGSSGWAGCRCSTSSGSSSGGSSGASASASSAASGTSREAPHTAATDRPAGSTAAQARVAVEVGVVADVELGLERPGLVGDRHVGRRDRLDLEHGRRRDLRAVDELAADAEPACLGGVMGPSWGPVFPLRYGNVEISVRPEAPVPGRLPRVAPGQPAAAEPSSSIRAMASWVTRLVTRPLRTAASTAGALVTP